MLKKLSSSWGLHLCLFFPVELCSLTLLWSQWAVTARRWIRFPLRSVFFWSTFSVDGQQVLLSPESLFNSRASNSWGVVRRDQWHERVVGGKAIDLEVLCMWCRTVMLITPPKLQSSGRQPTGSGGVSLLFTVSLPYFPCPFTINTFSSTWFLAFFCAYLTQRVLCVSRPERMVTSFPYDKI